MGEIFDAVELVREREWNGEGDGEESGGAGKKGPALDRAQLRQLTQRAQNEARETLALLASAQCRVRPCVRSHAWPLVVSVVERRDTGP